MQKHCMDSLDAPIERVTQRRRADAVREEPRGRGPAAGQRRRRRGPARALPGVAKRMAQIIGLPKLSPTMEEGVLVRWTKKEGDKVSPGDLVAEVETDKANMDFNIEDDGVLLKLLVKEGDTVKLGAPVAIIGKAGEDVSALVEQAKSRRRRPRSRSRRSKRRARSRRPRRSSRAERAARRSRAPSEQQPRRAAKRRAAPAPEAGRAEAGAPPAPAASSSPRRSRRRSRSSSASICARSRAPARAAASSSATCARRPRAAATATRSGAGRRPSAEADDDAEAAARRRRSRSATRARWRPTPRATTTDVPASNMRKRIAARLTEAKRDVPHFYLMRTFDAAPLLAFRGRLNDLLGDQRQGQRQRPHHQGRRARAAPRARVQREWEGDAIRQLPPRARRRRGRDRRRPRHAGHPRCRSEGHRLDRRGGQRPRRPREEASGSRATRSPARRSRVSNLGMFGIERFTAIINPPEAGILAIGTVVDAPVVARTARSSPASA